MISTFFYASGGTDDFAIRNGSTRPFHSIDETAVLMLPVHITDIRDDKVGLRRPRVGHCATVVSRSYCAAGVHDVTPCLVSSLVLRKSRSSITHGDLMGPPLPINPSP